MRIALIVALILGGVVAAGCATSEQHGNTPTSKGPYKADKSSVQSDPVCGVTVNMSSALQETWDGKTYYFHNEDCRRRFHENPEAYVPGTKEHRTEAEVR